MKYFILILLVITCVATSFAQSNEKKTEAEISNLMVQLAEASLKSDSSIAEKLYDENLILTSQSGKIYAKKDALQDTKNAFEIYRNEDLKFLHIDKKTVVVNYQNTRKRKTLDEAKFRITAVWVKKKDGWKIVSIQSSKIVTQGM